MADQIPPEPTRSAALTPRARGEFSSRKWRYTLATILGIFSMALPFTLQEDLALQVFYPQMSKELWVGSDPARLAVLSSGAIFRSAVGIFAAYIMPATLSRRVVAILLVSAGGAADFFAIFVLRHDRDLVGVFFAICFTATLFAFQLIAWLVIRGRSCTATIMFGVSFWLYVILNLWIQDLIWRPGIEFFISSGLSEYEATTLIDFVTHAAIVLPACGVAWLAVLFDRYPRRPGSSETSQSLAISSIVVALTPMSMISVSLATFARRNARTGLPMDTLVRSAVIVSWVSFVCGSLCILALLYACYLFIY